MQSCLTMTRIGIERGIHYRFASFQRAVIPQKFIVDVYIDVTVAIHIGRFDDTVLHIARMKGLLELLEMDDCEVMSQSEILQHLHRSYEELDTIVRDIVRKSEKVDQAEG